MGGSLIPSPLRGAGEAAPDDAARPAFRFAGLSEYPFKQRAAIRAISFGMAGLIRALSSTVRFEYEGREHWEAAAQGGRLPIYAFWHESIALSTYVFRRRNIVVMTSQSFDGEYIARCIQRFGYGAARGSSTRGGVGALVEMIRLMRHGYPTAFTVDGPKGPRHVAKMGAILLAKKTSQPLLPFGVTSSRCWNLSKSWDRTAIPKPFSRALVSFGQPITVDANADEAAQEGKLRELQASLDALEQRGQRWLAERSARPLPTSPGVSEGSETSRKAA
jgi:lysophospholipid acyltransferase (LPLAT)-like uncharacterized protein